MVQYFLQGGGFMWPILVLLLFGLGFGIERLITLFSASINTRKFLGSVRGALHNEGYDAAVVVCSMQKNIVVFREARRRQVC